MSRLLGNDISPLVRLFEESDLVEMVVERGGRKLRLTRSEQRLTDQPEEADPADGATQVDPNSRLTAHMVGTFYWQKADKRGKAAVSLEQTVAKGQVIGYIEAMGIMNEIEAGTEGRIVEIAASNGQPVEYGQPLLVLAPG